MHSTGIDTDKPLLPIGFERINLASELNYRGLFHSSQLAFQSGWVNLVKDGLCPYHSLEYLSQNVVKVSNFFEEVMVTFLENEETPWPCLRSFGKRNTPSETLIALTA